MKIYTKTGDGGETSLFGGGRVAKSEPRVGAYGDVDELNAAIGLAAAFLPPEDELLEELEDVQRALFGIGGEIATVDEKARSKLRDLVTGEDAERLERSIDGMEQGLSPLKSFILPGGSSGGAALHVARTVCRRAERTVVGLGPGAVRPEIVRYLNRLSDWLFVAARMVNRRAGVAETPW